MMTSSSVGKIGRLEPMEVESDKRAEMAGEFLRRV